MGETNRNQRKKGEAEVVSLLEEEEPFRAGEYDETLRLADRRERTDDHSDQKWKEVCRAQAPLLCADRSPLVLTAPPQKKVSFSVPLRAPVVAVGGGTPLVKPPRGPHRARPGGSHGGAQARTPPIDFSEAGRPPHSRECVLSFCRGTEK